MNNLAILVVDLLCHMTFAPEGGQDPEDSSDLERNSWQTLIHNLNDHEKEAVLEVINSKIDWLKGVEERTGLTNEERHMLSTLESYARGEIS